MKKLICSNSPFFVFPLREQHGDSINYAFLQGLPLEIKQVGTHISIFSHSFLPLTRTLLLSLPPSLPVPAYAARHTDKATHQGKHHRLSFRAGGLVPSPLSHVTVSAEVGEQGGRGREGRAGSDSRHWYIEMYGSIFHFTFNLSWELDPLLDLFVYSHES